MTHMTRDLRSPAAASLSRARGVLVLLLLASRAVLAQQPDKVAAGVVGRVSGIVTDSAMQPLADVDVVASGGLTGVRTKSDGRFAFPLLPAGSHLIQVRRLGYQSLSFPIVIADTSLHDLEIVLDVVPQKLAEVEVHAAAPAPDMNSFEGRMKMGFGVFVTRSQLEQMHTSALEDVVTRGVRGFRAVHTKDGHIELRSSRGQLSVTTSCTPTIWVDGIPASKSTFEQMPVNEIEAIEAYTGPATTPPEFLSGPCGAFLIWTRGGRINTSPKASPP
jgi:Carboxypeptidase regulatory-like domain